MVKPKLSNVFYFNFMKYKKQNESAVSNTLPVIPDALPPPLPPCPLPLPCPIPLPLPVPPVPVPVPLDPPPVPPPTLPPPEGAVLDEHSP